MDGDALFPRLLSPSIILRNGPPCSEYLPELREEGRPAFQFLEWRSHLTPQIILRVASLSFFPEGFIAVIAEVMIDGSSFCGRLQFGRLYAVLRLPTHALPLLSAGRASFFCPGGGLAGGTGEQLTPNCRRQNI